MLLVPFPANVELIYKIMEDTANFQPIPKDVIYDSMIAKPMGLPDTQERKE